MASSAPIIDQPTLSGVLKALARLATERSGSHSSAASRTRLAEAQPQSATQSDALMQRRHRGVAVAMLCMSSPSMRDVVRFPQMRPEG